MKVVVLLSSIFCVFLFQTAHAQLKVPLTAVSGVKFPNSTFEGQAPVFSQALAPQRWEDLVGFNELLPFVAPAPDQEDANSCMLMSLTGVTEWWLRRLNGVTRFTPNDDYDLSERWWMNLSEKSEYLHRVRYWFTDAIYLFNESASIRNRDYPLRKGWYVETEDDVTPAAPHQKGAEYGVRYSWHDETSRLQQVSRVEHPIFSRRILFKDEGEDPWAIGVAPSDLPETMVAAFQKYKAPIQVIYNHEGYWHSVFVIGYDAEMSSQNCPFINGSLAYFRAEAEKSLKSGDKETARKLSLYERKLNRSFEKNGGCHPKGMFYVRDSQYSDPSEPIYVYDPMNPSMNKPYSKRIVLREFDWIRSMANHVMVIYPRRVQ